jgi:hypothetical protein
MEESATTIHKLLSLLHSKVDTKLTDFFVITFEWLKGISQRLWNISFAETNTSLESIVTKDWHETRNESCIDSSSFAVCNPLEINFVVIEHLGDDDVGSSICFLLKMLNIIFSACGLHMNFWISSNDNAEIVLVMLLDESYELSCVSEPIVDRRPVFDTMWWITSESQDVPDSIALSSIQSFDDSFSCHTSASEMHKDIKTNVLGDMSAEIKCGSKR